MSIINIEREIVIPRCGCGTDKWTIDQVGSADPYQVWHLICNGCGSHYWLEPVKHLAKHYNADGTPVTLGQYYETLR